jgi:hypothetical protein
VLTHANDALIQAISAELISRARAMGAVTTVVIPYRNWNIPNDIVVVNTNRHSWTVD